MAYMMSKRGKRSLTNAVRRFNAKITRLEKNEDYRGVLLPERQNIKELMENVTSSKDYRNVMAEMERFFSPRATEIVQSKETGIRVLKYELNEAKIKVRQINKTNKAILEKHKPSVLSGARTGVKELNLQERHVNFDNKSEREWRRFMQALRRQSYDQYTRERAELYKKNYLKAIVNQLGSNGKALFKYVATLPPEVIYDEYFSGQLLELEYIYSPLAQKQIARASLSEWKSEHGQGLSGEELQNAVSEYLDSIDFKDSQERNMFMAML